MTSSTQYTYADLLAAAHVRFGRVKEERGRFRIPCVFHAGRNRNLVVFESGAAKCWSECGRNFSPTEVAQALGVRS
jgi:hypothetical protein